MRCVFWSEPKFLAVFSILNSKTPGSVSQLKCEVPVSQNQKSWRYVPVYMRGVTRLEPKFLAIISSLRARCLSVRTRIPGSIPQFKCAAFSVRTKFVGGISQCKCGASFGQDRNAWRYSPVSTWGVFRPEPKFLVIFSSLNARCFSVRTKMFGGFAQFECEACFSRGQNSWWYFPV